MGTGVRRWSAQWLECASSLDCLDHITQTIPAMRVILMNLGYIAVIKVTDGGFCGFFCNFFIFSEI